MESPGRWRIFSPEFSSVWVRFASISLLLELGQKYLHPFHGATSESLLIILMTFAIIGYIFAMISGSKLYSSYFRKRRK